MKRFTCASPYVIDVQKSRAAWHTPIAKNWNYKGYDIPDHSIQTREFQTTDRESTDATPEWKFSDLRFSPFPDTAAERDDVAQVVKLWVVG